MANANAYDGSRWDWVGNPSVTARQLQGRISYVGRLTAQASEKHRVSFNYEYQRRCEGSPLKVDTEDGCNSRDAGWIAAGTATRSAPLDRIDNVRSGPPWNWRDAWRVGGTMDG